MVTASVMPGSEACCTVASLLLLMCCRCSTFSSIPLPGDDQQGLIYSALHNSDDAAAAALKIEAAAKKEKGEAAQQNGADPNNPNPGPSKGRVPHRWQVVGMMSLAFVLCNMDKVSGAALCDQAWEQTCQQSHP